MTVSSLMPSVLLDFLSVVIIIFLLSIVFVRIILDVHAAYNGF